VSGSRVLRHADFRWAGVEVRAYKDPVEGLFRGVTRQLLAGGREAAEPLAFELRYFEVAPGGFSTLERHGHAHAVVVLRGHGSVLLEGTEHDLFPYDCVYVAPDAAHQFRAPADEPLGFLCVVDRDRDRPVPLGERGTGTN
jgi:quercetin dioxygenase-like cupin family protein